MTAINWKRRNDAVGDVRLRVLLDITSHTISLRAQDNGATPYEAGDVEWYVNGETYLGAALELPRNFAGKYVIVCKVSNSKDFDEVKITINPRAHSCASRVLEAKRPHESEIVVGTWAEAVAAVWMAQLLGQCATYKRFLANGEYVINVWKPTKSVAHYTFGGKD